MTDVSMRILLSATGASAVTSAVKGIAGALGSGGLGSALLGVGVAAAGLAIGLGVASVKASADFQQAMLSNVAHAGLAKSQIDSVSASVLKMATEVGRDPTQLAEALYPILSAFSGIQNQSAKSAIALDTLKLSFQAVAGTAVNGTDVANAAVGTFNALGLATNNVSTNTARMKALFDVMDLTVQQGNMQWDAYKNVISKLAVSIQGTGVKFNEASAALAVLTNQSFSAQKAQTYLSNMFTTMAIKTDAMAKHAKALHITFNENAYASMDLAHKVEYLNAVTDGNKQKLLALLGGNATALKSFNALSTGLAGYKSNLDGLNHSQGALQASFDTASQGFNFAMQRLGAAGQVLLVTIGAKLLPVLTQITSAVTPLVVQFTDWAVKNHVVEQAVSAVTTVVTDAVEAIRSSITWYGQWKDAINGTATAITLLFVPALIKSGVESVVAGVKIGVSYVANIAKTAIAGWEAAGKLAAFIGQIIASGAQAVIAGAKIAGQFLVSIVRAGIEGAITAGKFVASLIPAIISFAAQAVIAAASAVPAMIAGFIGWAAAAGGAAVATIAATWPILLIAAIIALVVVGIILAIQHWAQITKWFAGVWQTVWSAVSTFFVGLWRNIVDGVHHGLDAIGKAIQAAGGWLYSTFISPFVNAWSTISGIFGNIGAGISALASGNIPGALHDFGVPGFASGIENFSGGLAYVHRGEVLANLAPGTSVIPANRVQFGTGGHTTIFNISLGTMARNQSEVSRLVDLLEQELARRVRATTSNYNTGGIF